MLCFRQPLNILITKSLNYPEIIRQVLFTESALKTISGDLNLGKPPIFRGKELKHPLFCLLSSRPS